MRVQQSIHPVIAIKRLLHVAMYLYYRCKTAFHAFPRKPELMHLHFGLVNGSTEVQKQANYDWFGRLLEVSTQLLSWMLTSAHLPTCVECCFVTGREVYARYCVLVFSY